MLSQFADITARPDGIKTLRQTILDMAVRGKLVSQNATDEPAEKLLKRIAAEKQKLEKTGKIKKSNSLPPIVKDDIPYAVPDSWEWARLKDVINSAQPGFACGARSETGVIQFRMNNVTSDGQINWEKKIRVLQLLKRN